MGRPSENGMEWNGDRDDGRERGTEDCFIVVWGGEGCSGLKVMLGWVGDIFPSGCSRLNLATMWWMEELGSRIYGCSNAV